MLKNCYVYNSKLTGLSKNKILQNYIFFKKMNRLLTSILCLVLVYSQVTLRLNTKQTTRLNVDNSITSTLGLFRATLRKSNCSLQVYAFNQTTSIYNSKGFHFSPNVTKDCAYIQIMEGQIQTSQNQIFMYVGNSFNDSTIFTIDDTGVIRLIGTYIKLNRVDQQSFQANISTYYTRQKYIYSGTLINVRFQNTFGPLVNQNGWIYKAQLGTLSTTYSQRPDLTQNYIYSAFKFNNSQIIDFDSKTFPGALFNNISFQPRCFDPRIYLNFKAPFTIIADPYFPRVTVMEQGGYKVLDYTYAKLSEYHFDQDRQSNFYTSPFSLCPDHTFLHQGKCLLKCPAPYFHQIRGKTGSCRLVCQQYTPIDIPNRICTCSNDYQQKKYNSQMIKSCGNNTEKYPFGCYCKNAGEYFDRTISFSCVKKCPPTTFQLEGGICANCPMNCVTCQKDNFSRMFLECKQCAAGFDIFDGQCIRSCNKNAGNTLFRSNTTNITSCVKCTDQNCVDCSSDINVCKQCNIFHTLLSNGSCSLTCPTNTTQVPAQFFTTKCLPNTNAQCIAYLTSHYKDKPFIKCDQCSNNKVSHFDGCVSTCPTGYKRYDYQGYRYCSCQQGMTIDNQCLNITNCPLKMHYDLFSDSCLSCPFGCITCKGSICTSCYPGYFLYVSPQAILCRRKSPLFACDDQYSLWNGICLVKDFQNLQMTNCRAVVPNCRTCNYQGKQTCVICQAGYLLHVNTCILKCPQGFIPYQNATCIMTQIPNCQIPYLTPIKSPSLIDINLLQKSNPYKYYIFNGIQPANDPVGYIPYFQKLTSSKRQSDGTFRINSFYQPYWTCLKCQPGYGLAQSFSKCIPCVQPCATCYLALNTSCLTLKSTNPSGCNGYIEYNSRICIKSCNSSTSYPQLQNNILYCKTSAQARVQDFARIDSAIYVQNDNTKVVYYVFENKIPHDANVTVRIKKNGVSSSRLLQNQQNYTQKVVQIKDGRYFEVLTGIDENAVIADFTSSIYTLQSVEGYYPPNLIYGSTAQNTHPQFMKTWLSIIGQIMGPVIIVMHCIYIGNDLIYKMDNLIILSQTLYYFSFVKILTGKLLAQFYYGWIFSHCGFFPNFFTTPNLYRQNQAPISYKLATTDANFIRNAGFSISVFLVFLGGWALVSGAVFIISKFLHKKQIWYPNIVKNSLIGAVQLFSMNIMYWAIAHFLYRGDCSNCDTDYHNGSLAWAIIFTIIIWIYALGRIFVNPIGGMYMFKRLLIATILPAAFDNLLFLIPILILQVLFVAARFIVQKPQLKKQKLYILVEFAAWLLCYLLLFICTNAGVNTIIISIVIFIYIVVLMSDFSQVYLQSVNQWQLQPQNKHSQIKSGIQRAHTYNQMMGSQVQQVDPMKQSKILKKGSQWG